MHFSNIRKRSRQYRVSSKIDVQLICNIKVNLMSDKKVCVSLDGNDVQHLQIHVGEKPYKCELRDNDFNRENLLDVRMLNYTNKEPVKHCVCNKKLSNEHRLKESHLKVDPDVLPLTERLSENNLMFNKKIIKDEVEDNHNCSGTAATVSAFINETVSHVKVEKLEFDECNLQDVKEESTEENYSHAQDSEKSLNICQYKDEKIDSSM